MQRSLAIDFETMRLWCPPKGATQRAMLDATMFTVILVRYKALWLRNPCFDWNEL